MQPWLIATLPFTIYLVKKEERRVTKAVNQLMGRGNSLFRKSKQDAKVWQWSHWPADGRQRKTESVFIGVLRNI